MVVKRKAKAKKSKAKKAAPRRKKVAAVSRWAKVPKFRKPKTPWDLLGRVKHSILEEPRRYNQGLFISSLRAKFKTPALAAAALKKNDGYIQGAFLELGTPPQCGTVGCVAGWMVSMTIPDTQVVKVGSRKPHSIAGEKSVRWIETEATKLLGAASDYSYELFSGEALTDIRDRVYTWKPSASLTPAQLSKDPYRRSEIVGTPEYAKLGAYHITEFMKRHEKALRVPYNKVAAYKSQGTYVGPDMDVDDEESDS